MTWDAGPFACIGVRPLAISASIVCALLLGACGSSSDDSDEADRTSQPAAEVASTPTASTASTTPTSDPEVVPVPDTSSAADAATPTPPGLDVERLDFEEPAAMGLSVADLEAAGVATFAQPAIRFRSVAATSIPGFLTGSTVREGWYDVAADTGRGLSGFGSIFLHPSAAALTVEDFEADFGQLVEEVEGLRIEVLLVEGVLWQSVISDGTDSSWSGFDVDDFEDLTGSDARLVVDGGRYVDAFLGALVEEPTVAARPDGSLVWSVQFDADAVAPLAAGSGTVTRLFDAGFSGTTGLLAPGTITVARAGTISRVDVDVSEWWQEGLRAAGGGGVITDIEVALGVALAPMTSPMPLAAPCDEPIEDSSESVPTLVCQ